MRASARNERGATEARPRDARGTLFITARNSDARCASAGDECHVYVYARYCWRHADAAMSAIRALLRKNACSTNIQRDERVVHARTRKEEQGDAHDTVQTGRSFVVEMRMRVHEVTGACRSLRYACARLELRARALMRRRAKRAKIHLFEFSACRAD